MPSSTSNYGWSYPVSTDDLNAGATTIGSLATGIDSSLKTEALTRQGDVSTLTAAIDGKVKQGTVVKNIAISAFTVTTASNGSFTLAGVSPSNALLHVQDYFVQPGTSGWYVYYRTGDGALQIQANTAVSGVFLNWY